MLYDPKHALELLRDGTGHPSAAFRDGQEDAIRHIVEGKSRLLVVQKTGWGKSFVYFIATKLLREAGLGPALLISPLLALMRNQIAAAERMGVRADTINTDNKDKWQEVENRVAGNGIDILLISPERLANEDFLKDVLNPIAAKISLLVIDEAHCISDWGHDFRPDYRRIERIAMRLPPNLRLLATTATANKRVMDDLHSILGPNLEVSRGDLNRPSLTLQTIHLRHQADRLAWLAGQLKRLQGSGIVYTLTKRDANQVAEWLKAQGYDVEAYTGDTGDRREELEQALLSNHIKALVATTALGMGYDKPDLAFVIHYQMPGSVVAYYQQVGRAGRALDEAYGILLSGVEESKINDYFINSAFPARQEVAKVLEALEHEPEGLTIPKLLSQVNLSRGRIETTLKLLALENPAPIVKLKDPVRWQLAPSKLKEDFWIRADRLTALRKDEQQQMKEYLGLPFGEHMAYLIKVLGGDDLSVATEPTLPPIPADLDSGLVKAAASFLRRTSISIEPRTKWPAYGLPDFNVKGNIRAEHQAQPGNALSVWGDPGWSRLVEQGKYKDSHFSDELVAASAAMVQKWAPRPFPTWITCVPSLRHPGLVPDFAGRLADAMGLEFLEAIKKTKDRPEQKTMQNNSQRARNLDGSLEFIKGLLVPEGPVLLVDDWLIQDGR